ncbi:MAG: hypothetical protein ACRDZ4_11970 [Egibacteraceae bacterium]
MSERQPAAPRRAAAHPSGHQPARLFKRDHDALARWVIEAYWVGNELLDRVDLTTSATR